MTMAARSNGLLAVTPGTRLLGEVITWTCSGVAIRHVDLVVALRAAGLDEAVARELAPRHAFTRACKRLSERRITRPLGEDAESIRFQFTHESKVGDRFEYELESVLTLDKATGRVTCDQSGLAAMAQAELDRCIAARTGGDVTRVVQKLFEKRADLFPIRPQGGANFLPFEHVAFVEQVEAFLGWLNGRMLRIPVPRGTAVGDGAVKAAVAKGIAALIAGHRDAIAAFGADTRADMLARAAERVRVVRHKLAAYSVYLAEERGRLGRDLAEAAGALRAKVDAMRSFSAATA
jgi:hypothetical protein